MAKRGAIKNSSKNYHVSPSHREGSRERKQKKIIFRTVQNINVLKQTELHVHMGGCLTWYDFLELCKDEYSKIDWTLYFESYQKAYKRKPNLLKLTKEAQSGKEKDVSAFKNLFVCGTKDAGDFHKFQAKFNLLICLFRYYTKLNRYEEVIRKIVKSHKQEGIQYIEYRMLYPMDDVNEAIRFHLMHLKVFREESDSSFTAKYIPGVPRNEVVRGTALIQKLMIENPQYADVIVGLDFCHVEEGYPPKTLRPLLQKFKYDKDCPIFKSLPIVYHVGESYYDKSIESAIRWCHEAAEMGFKRLGHCIALGLDPQIALNRKKNAHVFETVAERLDQIDYDLKNRELLVTFGIDINKKMYLQEKQKLETFARNKLLKRTYNSKRLVELRKRQQFVLDRLAKLGTVIECCPTSNLKIGGVPNVKHHPIHNLLNSKVKLVICADDPGIFDCSLSSEIDWIIKHTKYKKEDLVKRLENPFNFKL